MHIVHHTDAFILKTTPAGEANKFVWLFTREFGLIMATVQGVRKSGAKLSMHLSEYSLASVDLVQGKDVWRLVNIVQIQNPFLGHYHGELGRSYVRTLAAVQRFCQGEERHEELFDHLASCLNSLADNLDAKSFDTLSLWRVMVLLGYGAVPDPYQNLLLSPFTDAVRELTPQARTQLVRDMNTVIKEGQL
jgi:DNA repair protein RecO